MYCTRVLVVEGFDEVVLAAAGVGVVLASTCILTGACEMVLFGALGVEVVGVAGVEVVGVAGVEVVGVVGVEVVGVVGVEVVGVVGGDTEVKVPALDETEVREDETEPDEEKELRNEADEVIAEAALVLVEVDDAPALRLLSGTELAAELLTVLLKLGNVGDAVETVSVPESEL